jgi:hypothetical protein
MPIGVEGVSVPGDGFQLGRRMCVYAEAVSVPNLIFPKTLPVM